MLRAYEQIATTAQSNRYYRKEQFLPQYGQNAWCGRTNLAVRMSQLFYRAWLLASCCLLEETHPSHPSQGSQGAAPLAGGAPLARGLAFFFGVLLTIGLEN